VKLHVWGGNNSNLDSVDGVDLNPTIIANNRLPGGPSEGLFGTNGLATSAANGTLGVIDKTAAADVQFALGGSGHVTLAYLLLEDENKGPGGTDNLLGGGSEGMAANRDNLYGGDVDFKFGRFGVSGGLHQSTISDNGSNVVKGDNIAWNAKVGYSSDKYGIWGAYRQVDNAYYAPGDWGRLGILVNPANIQGFQAGAHLDLSRAITLSAGGEWDKGNKNEADTNVFNSSSFGTNTKITDYNARLDLRLNPSLSLYGSFDYAQFESLVGAPAGASNTDFGWTTVGIGYGLSSNAKLNIAYEFSNAGIWTGGNSDGRYTGGLLTSQLTVKF